MLHVHRAARADALVAALRDLLAAPLDDPFAAELIAVPTRGMERWLAQTLSTGLGTTDGRRRRGLRQRRLPLAGSARRRGRRRRLGHRPRARPLVVRPAGLAAARGRRRGTGGAVAGRARRPSRRGHRPALQHRASSRRPLRRLRPAPAGDGARVAGDDGRGRALAGRAVAPAAGEGPRSPVPPSGWRRPSLGSATRRISSTLLHGSRCSALRAFRRRTSRSGRPRRRPRCPPLPPASVGGAVGRRGAGEAAGAVARRADDPTATLPQNRLLASWGRDARELQVVLGARRARRPPPSRRGRRGLAAGADPGRRPRGPRSRAATTGRCSPRTTAP